MYICFLFLYLTNQLDCLWPTNFFSSFHSLFVDAFIHVNTLRIRVTFGWDWYSKIPKFYYDIHKEPLFGFDKLLELCVNIFLFCHCHMLLLVLTHLQHGTVQPIFGVDLKQYGFGLFIDIEHRTKWNVWMAQERIYCSYAILFVIYIFISLDYVLVVGTVTHK